jgi:hypothetical protein
MLMVAGGEPSFSTDGGRVWEYVCGRSNSAVRDATLSQPKRVMGGVARAPVGGKDAAPTPVIPVLLFPAPEPSLSMLSQLSNFFMRSATRFTLAVVMGVACDVGFSAGCRPTALYADDCDCATSNADDDTEADVSGDLPSPLTPPPMLPRPLPRPLPVNGKAVPPLCLSPGDAAPT